MPDELPPDDTALGTQSATLEVGLRVFRQYVLKRFLSRGPLGSAWLVVHEGIGRELAMRFVPEAWLRDERVMSRLRDGVVRLLETTHPGLVGILDFVRDAQAAAIVSKFVDGETMVDAKARQPERCFSVETLRPWLVQVCEALDFAWRQHEAVHGDISPGNLLLTTGGDMKVLDFGLAKNLFDLDAPSGGPLLAVNVAYASPERIRGGAAGVADDVYAFGATVYELVTSKPPFSRGNVRFQVESVVAPSMAERRQELNITGEPIPPEWEEVIAACLAKVPEDRPKSLREVAERLGLLAPLPAAGELPAVPMILPRPAETVVGLRLPSPIPPGPIPEFPTSMPTAPMEPPTMIGSTLPIASEGAWAPAGAPEPPMESAPATVDENLDLEATISELETPLPVPAETGAPAAAPDVALEATVVRTVDAPGVPASASGGVTGAASVPATPATATTPFVPPAGVTSDDDAAATIAAEERSPSAVVPGPGAEPTAPPLAPPAPPSFTPPPGVEPSEDDASATIAAEGRMPHEAQPKAAAEMEEFASLETTATPPVAPKHVSETPSEQHVAAVSPAKPKDVSEEVKGLEDSVTLPTAVRRPDTPSLSAATNTEPAAPPPITPPLAPPRERPAAAAADSPKTSFRWLGWLAGLTGLVLVLAGGLMIGRRSASSTTDIPAATPQPTPMAAASPTPAPALEPPQPTPVPPTPPPPAGKTVALADVSRLADRESITEPLLLTGEFRVSTSTPAAAGRSATAVLRPVDPALSAQIRIIATLSGSAVPAEGSTLSLVGSSQYLIREVRRGADGQLNVRVEQR